MYGPMTVTLTGTEATMISRLFMDTPDALDRYGKRDFNTLKRGIDKLETELYRERKPGGEGRPATSRYTF
jgi:hypothetical protein